MLCRTIFLGIINIGNLTSALPASGKTIPTASGSSEFGGRLVVVVVGLVPLEKDDARRAGGGGGVVVGVQRVPDGLEADDDAVEQNVAGAGDLAVVFHQSPLLQPYATLATPLRRAQTERIQSRRACRLVLLIFSREYITD